jgi:hypothetical protein
VIEFCEFFSRNAFVENRHKQSKTLFPSLGVVTYLTKCPCTRHVRTSPPEVSRDIYLDNTIPLAEDLHAPRLCSTFNSHHKLSASSLVKIPQSVVSLKVTVHYHEVTRRYRLKKFTRKSSLTNAKWTEAELSEYVSPDVH